MGGRLKSLGIREARASSSGFPISRLGTRVKYRTQRVPYCIPTRRVGMRKQVFDQREVPAGSFTSLCSGFATRSNGSGNPFRNDVH